MIAATTAWPNSACAPTASLTACAARRNGMARRGFLISQWVDRIVTFVRGHRVMPQFGRPLTDWVARLRSLGFDVESRPMSQGTPFANVLLVADLSKPAR